MASGYLHNSAYSSILGTYKNDDVNIFLGRFKSLKRHVWGLTLPVAAETRPLCEHLRLTPPPRPRTPRSHSAPGSAPTSPAFASPRSIWAGGERSVRN